ncbi:MAG: CRTAC1 family protein [Planctomycetota bacterium]
MKKGSSVNGKGLGLGSGEPNDSGEGGDDAVIGAALRRSLVVIAILATMGALAAIVVVIARRPSDIKTVTTKLEAPTLRSKAAVEPPTAEFHDVTREAGIAFVHVSGANGEKLLPETMGAGCAWFDFDNDGDPDLLLINGDRWPWNELPGSANSLMPRPTMALYRNDGHGKFVDATADAGLAEPFYGTGVAIADYDGDGWRDVFVSSLGQDRLYRNEQGRFKNVTAAAGVAGAADAWGTSAAWLDYDRDGDLDLFVGNYVKWSREIDKAQDFRLVGVGRAYGPPVAFEGTFPYLYRNDGEGQFTDVSAEAGVQVRNPNTDVPMAKTMGVAPLDLDEDGWMDLIVANDTVQNFVFRNTGKGRFEEIGTTAGLAFDSLGNARGAMGIDTGWFRNDRCLGVAIGNFANEMTALYVAESDALTFFDAALATGLGPPTRLSLTFGVLFLDYDLDGRLDILSANGHLEEDINKVQPTQFYAQPPKLFWNCGPDQSTEFLPVEADKVGPDLGTRMVARGSAYADIDGDGDLDVVLTASGGSPRLLRNDQRLGHHWIQVRLEGPAKNRDAYGATARLFVGGQVLRRDVNPSRSYMSQSDTVLSFGLGTATKIDKLEIRWPDGDIQTVTELAIDQRHTLNKNSSPAKASGL